MNTKLLRNIIKQFIPFAQKHIGFKNPPRLFLRSDPENAKNPFGKTAFYDPGQKSVTLYISGRHPKDILRSLGHELVHHKQNCDGQFSDSDDTSQGYAQKDPHLRQMEMDANRDGSMCLRDFEDMLKKENTIYYEHLQKGDNKMSTKDWKNKEVTQLLAEAWGFKFNNLEEFNEFNGEGELQAESEEELDELAGASQSRERRKPHQSAKYKDEKPQDDDRQDESLEESEEELEEGDGNKKTDKHDDHPKLKGGQKNLPDALQKGIIGSSAADESDDDEDEKSDDDKKDESVDHLQEAIASLLRKHLRG